MERAPRPLAPWTRARVLRYDAIVNDVFLMSPPRRDWRVHGRANPYSQSQPQADDVAEGAALREWLGLADAIVDAGGHIAILPSDEASLTGMPYTAEAGYLGRERTFLLPNMQPAHRRGEARLIEALVRSWGLRTHELSVRWEGQGDVIDVGGRFVCTSGDGPQARTSIDAYQAIAPFLDGPSLHIRFRADPWFHGNTFLACFHGPNERIVVVAPDALLPGELARLRAFCNARFVEITREESLLYATNALQVGTTILAPKGAPARIFEGLGVQVKDVALPVLFGRGGGAAVCLTNRLAMSFDDVPVASRYETVRAQLVEHAR